jgi:hypothetical protein
MEKKEKLSHFTIISFMNWNEKEIKKFGRE